MTVVFFMDIADCDSGSLDTMCLGNAEGIRLSPMPLSLRCHCVGDKYRSGVFCNLVAI